MLMVSIFGLVMAALIRLDDRVFARNFYLIAGTSVLCRTAAGIEAEREAQIKSDLKD